MLWLAAPRRIVSAAEDEAGNVAIFGGGLPLRIVGEVIGAIGASDGTVEEDVAVAIAEAATLATCGGDDY